MAARRQPRHTTIAHTAPIPTVSASAPRKVTHSIAFADFGQIASHGVASKPAPVKFGIYGFCFRSEHHFLFWCNLSDGNIVIVTILRADC